MATRYRVRTVFRSLSPERTPIVIDFNCWRVTLCFGAAAGVPLVINGTDVGIILSGTSDAQLFSVGGAMAGPDPVPFKDTWTITNPAAVPFASAYLLILEYMDPQ